MVAQEEFPRRGPLVEDVRYEIAREANERLASSRGAEGFLELRRVRFALEDIPEEERGTFDALEKIVGVLAEGKSPEQVLNDCDEYASQLLGGKGSQEAKAAKQFHSLRVNERPRSDSGLNLLWSPYWSVEEISLIGSSGMIKVTRACEPTPCDCPYESVKKYGAWRGGEVLSLTFDDFQQQLKVRCDFYSDGSAKEISFYKLNYDPKSLFGGKSEPDPETTSLKAGRFQVKRVLRWSESGAALETKEFAQPVEINMVGEE